MHTGTFFFGWCAIVHNEYWWIGLFIIGYSIYGYWRNTYGVTAAQVEAETYEGKEFS